MRRHPGSTGGPERVLGLIVLLQALTVVMSGPATSPEYLPLRVAEAEGYFARENLSVTLRMTRAEPGAADVHAGLVPEPHATRLLNGSQALMLADLRTPGAVKDALGALTVNAAVFMRSDRRGSDKNLQAFAPAPLAA